MIIDFFSKKCTTIRFSHILMIRCSYLWSGYLSSCRVFYGTFEIVMAYTYWKEQKNNNYTHQHTKFNHIFKSMIKLHTPLNHASIKRIPTAMLCLRPSRVTPPYKMKLRSLRINQSVTLCNIIIFIVMTLTEGINNKSLLVTLTSDLNLEYWFSEEVSLFHNCKKEKLFELNGSFNSFFLPPTHDNTK